ncbi:invasion associated locus B family protein [Methylobacterium planeticum]|uniref:Invasion associated locus B family protein n=1 Tax=Methylobacterium planeticum TaxID=2615211 RepID=A0A6N6MIZ0_9HYPH|nr:invasion associated locus B family protein [Methylobacterium planeticum]KAB1069516.1 invasion associated locus B family protein [Methylobacterium planeticum]
MAASPAGSGFGATGRRARARKGGAKSSAMRAGLGALGLVLLAGASPEAPQLRGLSAPEAGAPAPDPEPAYRLKPADIAVPEGAPRGSVRRLIQPFGPWTLICDEDLRRRTKICNVSQTILDRSGVVAFSWSLSATRAGAPAFILRAPIAGPARPLLTLRIAAAGPRAIDLARCDARQCLGFLPVTPGLRAAIRAGAAVEIAYRADAEAAPIRLSTTLDGLAGALAAIR